MINEKYFEDAFILHDETENQKFIKELKDNIKLINKLSSEDQFGENDIYETIHKKKIILEDIRNELITKWVCFSI
jgi:hypothetical protein